MAGPRNQVFQAYKACAYNQGPKKKKKRSMSPLNTSNQAVPQVCGQPALFFFLLCIYPISKIHLSRTHSFPPDCPRSSPILSA